MARPKADAAKAASESLPLDPKTWLAVASQWELSPQQTKIVELLLYGMRDKQIAHELGLGVPTVRTYLARIFLKVNTQDRVELILCVFRTARAMAMRPVN